MQVHLSHQVRSPSGQHPNQPSRSPLPAARLTGLTPKSTTYGA